MGAQAPNLSRLQDKVPASRLLRTIYEHFARPLRLMMSNWVEVKDGGNADIDLADCGRRRFDRRNHLCNGERLVARGTGKGSGQAFWSLLRTAGTVAQRIGRRAGAANALSRCG